jgi:hypothetical protein
MLDQLSTADGARLSLDEYITDFAEQANRLGGEFWKFERRQSFKEPTNASWQAFERGDEAEALRLAVEQFPQMRQEAATEPFSVASRVRVVEEPLTPYLRWQLFRFQQWAQLGEQIHILPVEQIRDDEGDTTWPEVVVIGRRVAYEVLYDSLGAPIGARRIASESIAVACAEFVESLVARSVRLDDWLQSHPEIPTAPTEEYTPG